MKFDIKIGSVEDTKATVQVLFSEEKKKTEVKVVIENSKTILSVGLGKDKLTVFDLQKIGAAIAKKAKAEEIESLALECPKTCLPAGRAGLNPAEAIRVLTEGLILGSYEFKKYHTKKEEQKVLESVTIFVKNASEAVEVREGISKAEIYCKATILARDLVNEPSSVTTPTYLANLAMDYAKKGEFSLKVFDKKEIEKLGMGAFLGVAKGSDEPPKFLELKYLPSGKQVKTIVLIGKGVTFDTGGISLKPLEGMETMKMDMAGGAAVIAIFSVLKDLRPKYKIIGLIPLTENMPSGKAIKPGDIVKTFDGKNVEVINTDAEGRLILADALGFALTLKPDMIVDLATLTGACMVALGENIAGLFTNDVKLRDELFESAKKAGEKLWSMPLEEEYKELLKSEVADLKNVSGKKYGGAITAALFLQEFVNNCPWAHLDMGGPAWEEKGTELVSKGGTGFGVRTILNFLENS